VSFHHLDQYASVASPLTRTVPAARVLGVAVLAVGAATLPLGAWPQLAVLGIVVVGIVAAARIPPRAMANRLAGPFAFLLLASAGLLFLVPGEPLWHVGPIRISEAGLERFGFVLGRASVALAAAVVLVSTTSFPELLHGLRALRVPGAVATALGLAYRFLYLTLDELERLQRAARSRNAGHGAARRRHLLVAVTAATLGRSLARGERTHDAMLARGFAGTLPLLHVSPWTPQAAIELAMLLTVAAAVAVQARVG